MANKILRGNDLMIFKDTTGAGTAYKALAFSTSCQLDVYKRQILALLGL